MIYNNAFIYYFPLLLLFSNYTYSIIYIVHYSKSQYNSNPFLGFFPPNPCFSHRRIYSDETLIEKRGSSYLDVEHPSRILLLWSTHEHRPWLTKAFFLDILRLLLA